MKAIELSTNDNAVKVMIVKAGLVVLCTCILITLLFKTVLGLGLNVERYVLWSLWIILPGAWVLGSMIADDKSRKTAYVLADDALIIRSRGLFGPRSQRMYRYDVIAAVEVKQNSWGNRYNYGDIYLDVPRLHCTVILRAVSHPEEQALQIKARTTRSLKMVAMEAP